MSVAGISMDLRPTGEPASDRLKRRRTIQKNKCACCSPSLVLVREHCLSVYLHSSILVVRDLSHALSSLMLCHWCGLH